MLSLGLETQKFWIGAICNTVSIIELEETCRLKQYFISFICY